MAVKKLMGSLCLTMGLLWIATSGDAVAILSAQKSSALTRGIRSIIVTDPKLVDPALTSYTENCPNGYIAFSKFNTTTGVFDCAIKTAEICFALCLLLESSNWHPSNPIDILDPREKQGWYCRALPGTATKPCFFKRRWDIEWDVTRGDLDSISLANK